VLITSASESAEKTKRSVRLEDLFYTLLCHTSADTFGQGNPLLPQSAQQERKRGTSNGKAGKSGACCHGSGRQYFASCHGLGYLIRQYVTLSSYLKGDSFPSGFKPFPRLFRNPL
jgi:hypothetical protein